MISRPRAPLALCLSLFVAAAIGACGGGGGVGGGDSGVGGDSGATTSSFPDSGAGDSGADAASDATSDAGGQGDSSPGSGEADGGDGGLGTRDGGDAGDAGDAAPAFDVEPQTITSLSVTVGQTMPTAVFTATLGGNPIAVAWSVDRGDLGSITAGPSTSATFTPTGTTGGLVTIVADLDGQPLQRQVFVELTATQNGFNSSAPAELQQVPSGVASLTAGGGVGGVGGEGLGPAVTDPATLTALAAPPSSDGSAQGLAFLYPYDKTVWPRGLLAPLLMWTWAPPGGSGAPGDADAIKVDLTTTTSSFTWSGTFGRPTILATTGGPFLRMPIPQDVWDMATNTAGGKSDQLTVSLTVARGGVAYGPISETWTIAPVRLGGTIFYQSYGTQLVQNFGGTVGGNGLFGAAVLSLKVGDTAPKLVAGTASTSPTGCRSCHSADADGARLVAVEGNDEALSSVYDLSATPPAETIMKHLATYPAMYPDGTLALTPTGTLLPLPNDATPIATTGLTSVVSNLGQPGFSPDGTTLAFNPLGGSLKNNESIYVMSFDRTTSTFSNPVLVADDTGQPPGTQPGWPAFLPDSKSLVYHHQTVPGNEDNLATRAGSHAQIYWTSGVSPNDVTPLDALDGKGYLPKLPVASTLSCYVDNIQVAAGPAGSSGVVALPDLDHGDDVDLNYEPTVLPVGAGGYAWVVFTSRRLYGSEATIPPFCSDPRGVNLITNITTKKLWLAAIDLTQAPGTDSSHPAFYLPAQELIAANARGVWTLAP